MGRVSVWPGDLRECRCEQAPSDDLQVSLQSSTSGDTCTYVTASGKMLTRRNFIGCGSLLRSAIER